MKRCSISYVIKEMQIKAGEWRTPGKGSLWFPWTGRAKEKDLSKRPSDLQLQEAWKKDSDRAITPATETVCVPAHLAPPGSPKAKQLHHLHTQLSLGQSCPSVGRGGMSCVYKRRIPSVLSDSLRPCRLWPTSLLCQRWGSPGKNTGAYWPTLIAIPF